MGVRDKLEKQYLCNNDRFADAFNYYVYKGRQVVDPKKLKEIDSTEIVVPYGKIVEEKRGKRGLGQAKAPTQRFRDEIKVWEVLHAMADDKKVYVILGAEAQDKVHYAAPVKDGLYDFMNYAKQVTESAASYKKKDNEPTESDAAEAEEGNKSDDRIKVTSEEFLSGFHKGDYLMPVVTLMIYFGSDEWDGPMTIHEMFEADIREDVELMSVVPDYKLNLLTPNEIPDEDFDKFKSEFGAVMFFLKKQNVGSMEDWIAEFNERFGIVGHQTAELVNTLSNSKLAIEEVEDERGVDMCKAFERSMKKTEEKKEQETKAVDINKMVKNLKITVEQAMDALEIPQSDRSKYAELVGSTESN